jgi:type IV pilus assembly protein PilW
MLRRVKSGPYLHSQRGYSLVELMIALLIALFLLGGLITLVMGTRKSSGTESALSQLQDNERIAMTLITNIVEKGGYFPYPSALQLTSFTAETFSGVSLAASQVVGGTYNAAAPGDTFAVRFMAPFADTTGQIINCAGQSNTLAYPGPLPFEYFNVFQVANVNGTWWLQCVGQTNNNGTVGGLVTVNLIPNVTQISILYGVGSNLAGTVGDYSVVQYLNASQMTPTLYQNVTSIKVRLYFLLPQYGTVGGQMMTVGSANSTQWIERVIPIMSRAGVNVI